MKRFLFLLFLIPGINSAHAQLTDVWINGNITLSNHQWHYDGLSIIATTGPKYLVITPEAYFYRTLPPYRTPYFLRSFQDRCQSYCPYFYNGRLGWYVAGYRYHYFYDIVAGTYLILDLLPTLRNFWLDLHALRHLDLRHWRYFHRAPVHPPHFRNYPPRASYRHHGTPPGYRRNSGPAQPRHQVNPPHGRNQPHVRAPHGRSSGHTISHSRGRQNSPRRH